MKIKVTESLTDHLFNEWYDDQMISDGYESYVSYLASMYSITVQIADPIKSAIYFVFDTENDYTFFLLKWGHVVYDNIE